MKEFGRNAKAGEAIGLRILKPGWEYDYLFEKAPGNVFTVKKNAGLSDTVQFIPAVVQKTKDQTKKFASFIKENSTYETCKKIWHFIFEHIQYKKDEKGYEQIRSPRRAWHDREQGVDCDCYSVFISTTLVNLGIPHLLRITKYKENYFQHIYPIVPLPNGRYITIDCVTNQFDFEEPYSEKKDFPMELQFLDGFDNDLGSLGKIKKAAIKKPALISKKKNLLLTKLKAKAKSKATSTQINSAPVKKKKKGGLLKKVVSKINKINPATILLRNGLLAAMKLNTKNVAARLKWSYLSPEQAATKGIDPDKYNKLVAVRQKLENIFSVAGGKTANLKKAILKGKGNKDHTVSGLGDLPDNSVNYISQYTPIDQLLGQEIYYSENIEGMEGFSGFGELGEPLTLTTMAAAMGVIAGIVASLKQIGDIFGGKGKGSEDFDENKTEAPENNVAAADKSIPGIEKPPSEETIPPANNEFNTNSGDKSKVEIAESEDDEANSDERNVPVIHKENGLIKKEQDLVKNDNANTNKKEAFWEKNKSWIKPVAIIGGSIGLISIGLSVLNKNHAKNKSSPKVSLSGLPRKKKKKLHKHFKKFPVELL